MQIYGRSQFFPSYVKILITTLQDNMEDTPLLNNQGTNTLQLQGLHLVRTSPATSYMSLSEEEAHLRWMLPNNHNNRSSMVLSENT